MSDGGGVGLLRINEMCCIKKKEREIVSLMGLNAIFNNISAISWRSNSLMEYTVVPERNINLRKSLTNFITKKSSLRVRGRAEKVKSLI
jgi:hypothetical protein